MRYLSNRGRRDEFNGIHIIIVSLPVLEKMGKNQLFNPFWQKGGQNVVF
jgi:hypothetical protein